MTQIKTAKTMELVTGHGNTIQATRSNGYWHVVEYNAEWTKVANHGEYATIADAKIAMVTASLRPGFAVAD